MEYVSSYRILVSYPTHQVFRACVYFAFDMPVYAQHSVSGLQRALSGETQGGEREYKYDNNNINNNNKHPAQDAPASTSHIKQFHMK